MLTFELVTPEGVKFTEECYEILLPTPDGQIGVLPHHIPLVSLATAGTISVRRRPSDSDAQLEHFATSGGMVEIDGKRVRLLADSAEHAQDIDEKKAQEALASAQELIKGSKDQVAISEAAIIIENNQARLRVAELRRRHHSKLRKDS